VLDMSRTSYTDCAPHLVHVSVIQEEDDDSKLFINLLAVLKQDAQRRIDKIECQLKSLGVRL
jgi:hypothetical protein